MATVTGTRFSFTDSTNVAIDMSDTLAMISPFDVPLLQRYRQVQPQEALRRDEARVARRCPALARYDPATVGEFNGTGAVTTSTVTAGHRASASGPGDVILIESELVLINSISTDTLNILAGGRGYGGSTAAAHLTGVAMSDHRQRQRPGRPAGRARGRPRRPACSTTPRSTRTRSSVTSTARRSRSGSSRTRWTRRSRVGSSSPGSTGSAPCSTGARSPRRPASPRRWTASSSGSPPTPTPRLGAYLVEDFVLQALQDCWAAGAPPDLVVANAFQKRQMQQVPRLERMTTRTDRIAGAIVDTYTSDFGTVGHRARPQHAGRHGPRPRERPDRVRPAHRPRPQRRPPSRPTPDSRTRCRSSASTRPRSATRTAHAKITGLATS